MKLKLYGGPLHGNEREFKHKGVRFYEEALPDIEPNTMGDFDPMLCAGLPVAKYEIFRRIESPSGDRWFEGRYVGERVMYESLLTK